MSIQAHSGTNAGPSGMALFQADTPEHVKIVRAPFGEYTEATGTNLEYQSFSAELAALPNS